MVKRVKQSRNSKGKPNLTNSKFTSTRKQIRTNKFDRKKTSKYLSHKTDSNSLKRETNLKSRIPKVSLTKPTRKFVKKPSLVGKKGSEDQKENVKLPKLRLLPRKKRRELRQSCKPNFELAKKTKSLWERLRVKKYDSHKREELIGQLLKDLAGKIHILALRHDTSRVIQTIVKYGTEDQLTLVLEELKTEIVPICKTRYSKFLITSFLKNGSAKQRGQIIGLFSSHVRELLRHSEASQVLELAYNDYANKEERREIILEVFSSEFVHYKPEFYSLKEVVEGDANKQTKISKNLKDYLVSMETKPVWGYSMIHRTLLEFFSVAREQDKIDLVQILSKKCVEMVHTRDGACSIMHFVWNGTAKDRKIILNSFKLHLKKICLEDHGYLPIISIFDSVDDTVLVSKIFLGLTQEDYTHILSHHQGRKIYLYLISPRDSTYFHPDITKVLKVGDGNTTSRKPADTRISELQEKILPEFIKALASSLPDNIQNKSNSILYLAALRSNSLDLTVLDESLVQALKSNPSIVEEDSAHVVVISAFKRHNSNTLLALVLTEIGIQQMAKWAYSNRGALVLDCAMSHADIQTKTELFVQVFDGHSVPSATKGLSLLRTTIQS